MISEIPVSLSSLKVELENKFVYKGSRTSLFHVLKKIGFTYKKDDPRRGLMEKPHIVFLRYEFLKYYMDNEELAELKKPYVFLDETWIFSNGSVRKSWQNDDVRSVKRTKGDGTRYIIVHAGTEKGFINGASLIFKSGLKSGDYHGEMNSQNFEEWLQNDLLPALEEPSIIIMDNASYHSRQLNKSITKSSKKEVMQTWLKEKNVKYPETATKDVLWNLISQIPKPNKSFVVDSLIQSAGHEVLRLPPYHCQFNAIEMVWSQAKRFYDKEVLASHDVLGTWKKAVDSVTATEWANYVNHTNKVINAAWGYYKNTSPSQQPVIINLDSDSDEDIDFWQEIDSD